MTLPDMIDPKAVRQMEPHEYNMRVWADKQALEVIDRQKDRIRAFEAELSALQHATRGVTFQTPDEKDVGIGKLEAALHKAFSQFENITVAATLEIAKDRAHSFIGWYYNNIETPEGSPASGEVES